MTDPNSFLTADGARIVYRDEGSGRPVLMLHGMFSRGDHWRFQRDALIAAGYRVITFDQRFHGDSAHPESGLHLHRLGQDLAELIDLLDLHTVSLIAHSMGVSVALAYVDLHGTAEIERLVIIDESARIVNDATWSRGVWGVTWDLLEAQAGGTAPWGAMDREPALPSDVLRMFHEVGGFSSFGSVPLALRIEHFATDWRDVVPRVDVPTWIVAGRNSMSFPTSAMEWYTRVLADSSLTVYERSGHTPHWNEHEVFNRDLLAFLAR